MCILSDYHAFHNSVNWITSIWYNGLWFKQKSTNFIPFLNVIELDIRKYPLEMKTIRIKIFLMPLCKCECILGKRHLPQNLNHNKKLDER